VRLARHEQLATDAAIGSLPRNRGSLPGSLIVPIDRILSLSLVQPSMPIASIAATPIGLLAHTPPSTSSTADSVM
jgi:hypothetical protein